MDASYQSLSYPGLFFAGDSNISGVGVQGDCMCGIVWGVATAPVPLFGSLGYKHSWHSRCLLFQIVCGCKFSLHIFDLTARVKALEVKAVKRDSKLEMTAYCPLTPEHQTLSPRPHALTPLTHTPELSKSLLCKDARRPQSWERLSEVGRRLHPRLQASSTEKDPPPVTSSNPF